MENFNKYIDQNIKPNIKVGTEPDLNEEEFEAMKYKEDVIREKFVFWKKSKQIVITKAFKNRNPLPELVEFLEKILYRSIPIDITIWIDFFGLWRSGRRFEEDSSLGFVWASKATSMIKDFDANSHAEINDLKDLLNTDMQHLFEQWVETHLETVFCQSSKVHAERITNALIFLEIEDL